MNTTTQIRTIRCSALPAAFDCPGSLAPVDLAIDPVSPPADEGSAGHEVMRQIAETDAKSLDGIDLQAAAHRYGVDVDDLRPQAFNALWIWRQIRDSFPDARGELDLRATFGTFELTGHLDLLSVVGQQANLADWKFGRLDRNYAEQVFGYATLVFANYPEVQTVSAFLGWMRDREVEPYTITRERAGAWVARLREQVVQWDGTYHPGPGCFHCRRSTECPAVVAMARRDIAVISEIAEQPAIDLATMEPAQVVQLHRRAKMVAKFCESLETAVKLRVDQEGGALPDGAGTELRFVTITKREVDGLKAWPVLQACLSDEEIAGCMKIGIGKLEDAVATKAGKGKGAGAKRDLAAALEAADAITVNPSRQLRDMRTK
jgi:hypothetical protein